MTRRPLRTSAQVRRSGATLVELLVVLVLVGVLTSIVGLAYGADPEAPRGLRDAIADARRAARTSHRTSTRRERLGGAMFVLTAHPDGRLLVDSAGIVTITLSGNRDASP